jgi:hypothetical protein
MRLRRPRWLFGGVVNRDHDDRKISKGHDERRAVETLWRWEDQVKNR